MGLSHSDTKDALMAPFYRGFQSKPKLETDDIKGIQALYGQKSTRTDDDTNNVESNVIDTEESKEQVDSTEAFEVGDFRFLL